MGGRFYVEGAHFSYTHLTPELIFGRECVKLKVRIRNTTIKQTTRVTDIVQYVTNTKRKWTGHIARMKDNRWTIRSTEWQTEGVRSAERPREMTLWGNKEWYGRG